MSGRTTVYLMEGEALVQGVDFEECLVLSSGWVQLGKRDGHGQPLLVMHPPHRVRTIIATSDG